MDFDHNELRRFDDLFQSNRSWCWKLVGATAVGLMIDVSILATSGKDKPMAALVLELNIIPLAIVLAAAVLIRRDVVHAHLAQGCEIDVISRLLFAAGGWSKLVWILVLISATVVLSIWVH